MDDVSDSEDGQMDTAYPKGLQNIGNTCYMNSALQALCNIPPLREHFTQSYYPMGVDDKKRNLSRNFQRLIEEMCDKHGPDYLIPNGILHGIRSVRVIYLFCCFMIGFFVLGLSHVSWVSATRYPRIFKVFYGSAA